MKGLVEGGNQEMVLVWGYLSKRERERERRGQEGKM
jgi:hypothetical protein